MVVSCFAMPVHFIDTCTNSFHFKVKPNVYCKTRKLSLRKSFVHPLPCLIKKPSSSLNSNKRSNGLEVFAAVRRNRKGVSRRFVDFREIFVPGSLKIDEKKYSNVWLTDLPHLARECSTRTLTSVLSDVVKVGENDFQVENETFEDIAELLVPKQFPSKFPVVETSGDKISRILLRRELITRWNKRIESLGRYGYNFPSKQIVLSAAGGLGKSIDLYLFAVFAKHCRIPVQYIGNTSEWLKNEDISKMIKLYLKMLLFMNADILDELPSFIISKQFNVLNLPLKNAIYFTMKTENISLAMDIRDFITRRRPRNFLIVDEHNALWRMFGENIRSWPGFVAYYTNLEAMRTEYCGILIAGSQHHAFEETLPSGYARAKEYVEPLNFEEFDLWQRLTDYPQILREHQEEVIELTGLVPRMIAEIVSIARENPNSSFQQVEMEFRNYIYSTMEEKHEQYVNSLRNERQIARFSNMLRLLFLGESAPELLICNGAYRDRGLLIAMNDGTLRFYNSLARDVLLSSFLSIFASDSNLAKLVEIYRTERSTRGQTFEQLFFFWFIQKKGEVTIRSDNKPNRTLSFDCNAWVLLDRGQFNPQVKKFTHSCWISLGERYPRFDYIYVHIVGFQWHIYFFQVSVSPFSRHDRG